MCNRHDQHSRVAPISTLADDGWATFGMRGSDVTKLRVPTMSRVARHSQLLNGLRGGAVSVAVQDHEPGAILGARPHSQPRTTTDAHGEQSAVLSVKADSLDQFGRLVEIYGSEGWGFESLRVRNVFSLVRDIPLTDGGLTIRAQGQLTATLTATRFNSAGRRLDPWRPRLRVARSA